MAWTKRTHFEGGKDAPPDTRRAGCTWVRGIARRVVLTTGTGMSVQISRRPESHSRPGRVRHDLTIADDCAEIQVRARQYQSATRFRAATIKPLAAGHGKDGKKLRRVPAIRSQRELRS